MKDMKTELLRYSRYEYYSVKLYTNKKPILNIELLGVL